MATFMPHTFLVVTLKKWSKLVHIYQSMLSQKNKNRYLLFGTVFFLCLGAMPIACPMPCNMP